MRSVLSSYGKGIHTLRGQLRRIEPVSFKAHAPAASPMCEMHRRQFSAVTRSQANLSHRSYSLLPHSHHIASTLLIRSLSKGTDVSLSQSPSLANAASSGDAVFPGFLPEPPSPLPTEELLTALGEPTLASLGLGGWGPIGLVQSLLENIHVLTGLPWGVSLLCLTVIVRTTFIPLSVIQIRNAAHMHNHGPSLQRLQEAQMNAAQSGDHGKLEKASAEYWDYMKRNDCNPFKTMLRPLMAAPIFLSVFYGIRGMTSLPVEGLKTGGALWFPDLTLCDPYLILPAMSALTVFYVTKTGAEGVSSESMPPAMKMFFNILPVFIFVFTAYQPAALALYWTASNMISVSLSKLMKTDYMKTRFNIPDMIKHPSPNTSSPTQSRDFMADMMKYKRAAELSHEIEDRKKVGALRFNQVDKSKAWDDQTETPPPQRKPYPGISDSQTAYDPTKPRLNRKDFAERTLTKK